MPMRPSRPIYDDPNPTAVRDQWESAGAVGEGLAAPLGPEWIWKSEYADLGRERARAGEDLILGMKMV